MPDEADTEPTRPEGWVTVGQFSDPVEAQMARGMLESAGVECSLVGENVNNLMVGLFETLTLVQVRPEDEAAARELMPKKAGDGPEWGEEGGGRTLGS